MQRIIDNPRIKEINERKCSITHITQ